MDDNDMAYISQGIDSANDESMGRPHGDHPEYSGYQGTRTPYVRRQRPRKSAEAIDNLEEDDNYSSANYCHDSNVSVGGTGPFSGRMYSRSRANVGRMQRTSQYARYLEIPKGKRQIFASQERARQVRSRAWLVAIFTILLIALVLVLSLAARS